MRALPVIVVIMALGLMASPALAADMTVPINKDYTYSLTSMVVHISKMTISDYPSGNVFSAEPDNTEWYDLYFTYENKGKDAMNGNFEVAFFDDKGNQYPGDKRVTDITMNPVNPGQKSETRFVEVAVIPRDTKITSFKVFEGFNTTTYNIPYSQAITATATVSQHLADGSSASSSCCCLPFLLPFLAVGLFIAYKVKK